MTLLHRLGSIARWMFRRNKTEQELDDELRTFVDMAAAAKLQEGLSPGEARRQARLDLGGLEQIKERVRTTRHGAWLDEAARDLAYAFRTFLRNPGFTLTVIITLALGIGANTAIFSLFNAVILRTLPVRAPEELSLIYRELPSAVGDVIGGLERSEIFAHTALVRFEDALPPRTSLAAMSAVVRFNLRLGTDSRIIVVPAQLVSGGYFTTFGIVPDAGRLLTVNDNRIVDGHPVAVVSYGFAQQQFGSSPGAIGQVLPINGVAVTIVGVARPGFTGVSMGNGVQVWLPAAMQHVLGYRQNAATHNADNRQPWLSQSGIEWLNLVIRTGPDDLSAARLALRAANQEEAALEAKRRGEDDEESRRLVRGQLMLESFAGGFSTARTQFSNALVMLMMLVAVLLLIACANITNLLLARASARRREIAMRLALGAGRWRLVRQLLAESALLSFFGCIIAVPLARWLSISLAGMAAVRAALPEGFALDGRVLTFAACLTVAAALLVGLLPALRATNLNVSDALKGTGRTGVPASRLMRPLIVAQVGLSVVLVAAAALFGRSLLNLWRFDPGFHRDQLVSVRIAPPTDFVSSADQATRLQDLIRERARAVPGVIGAEFSTTGIASGLRSISGNVIEGYEPQPGEIVRLQENAVGLAYFTTVGMVLRDGRTFTDQDVQGSPHVALVNEAAVRRYFGGRSPVGKRLGYGTPDTEVVGVISDARVNGLREAPVPMAFYPLEQYDRAFPQYFDIRAAADPARVGADVRRVLLAAEPRLIVSNVVAIEEALGRSMGRDRLMAYVAFGFGAMALLLACIGLYGVMSYTVIRRTQELGIRAALGAQPTDLVRFVVSDGMRVVALGVVVGVVTTFAASRTIEALLFDIEPSDPTTYMSVIATLAAAGLIACYVPARRASHVEPMVALRHD